MCIKKIIFILPLLMSLLIGCDKGNQCPSREACLKDPKCLCWCSQICNYRKKTAADNPVYIEKDPNGKFCYCKQWDVDNYQNNCILKMDIKEEP